MDKPISAKEQSYLAHYEVIRPSVDRISSMVQQHPEFFYKTANILGKCCVRVAADKLESLINEWKKRQ